MLDRLEDEDEDCRAVFRSNKLYHLLEEEEQLNKYGIGGKMGELVCMSD